MELSLRSRVSALVSAGLLLPITALADSVTYTDAAGTAHTLVITAEALTTIAEEPVPLAGALDLTAQSFPFLVGVLAALTAILAGVFGFLLLREHRAIRRLKAQLKEAGDRS